MHRSLQAVSKTGGHLGSSLGVIELTTALHYVFDAPEDKITWDVSHQVRQNPLQNSRVFDKLDCSTYRSTAPSTDLTHNTSVKLDG